MNPRASLSALLSRAERITYALTGIKSISGYVGDYVVDLTTLISAVFNGKKDGADMRRGHVALLKEYAEPTYKEGMWESGEYETRGEVDENFEDDDDRSVSAWIAEQRGFTVDFSLAAYNAYLLFKRDDPGAGAAQDAVLARAEAWGESLRALGTLGKVSGKKNQMGTWRLGQTEKHCNTCLELDGTSHRVSWYIARNYFPGKPGAAMDCFGTHCDCKVEDKNGERLL